MTASPPLPAEFLATPLAHRGLHDRAAGRPENSCAAFAAAVDGGYGIELDLQLSADGKAMVFHDATLDRMTSQTGRVNALTAKALGGLRLLGTEETIPTLREVLDLVAGRVPLLLELKDQSGSLSEAPPVLEQAVAEAVAGYSGPLALMSFNPNMVAALADRVSNRPCGIVTEHYAGAGFSSVPADVLAYLRSGPDLPGIGASFVSHDHNDLARVWVQDARARGVPVLCWTIRTPEQEAVARRHADNVTFEGYLPGRAAT